LIQGVRRARTFFFLFVDFLMLFFFFLVLLFSLSDLGLLGLEVDPMRHGWVKCMDPDLVEL
jgi:hypothetical protein